MEIVQINVKEKSDKPLVVAPLGDIQWMGEDGPTAQNDLRRHIDKCMKMNAYFLGMGDYTDFLSPSNRQKLLAAGLYDMAGKIIKAKAWELVDELFDKFLKPTVGHWIGLLEGHHFFEAGDTTSDMYLASLLKTRPLGTSCYVRLTPPGVVLWAHHGQGGGVLPSAPLNKLYHVAGSWGGADVFLMGHTTKMSSVVVARPYPDWSGEVPVLANRMIRLVNTGGFSESSVVGGHSGNIPRGDYAEQRMLAPSPLAAPLLVIDVNRPLSNCVTVVL